MSDVDLMLEVEKFLYSLDDVQPEKGEKECNIFLQIVNVGSWVCKFRIAGNIINRRELILGELVHLDAKIVFKSITVFHTVMIGGSAFEDEMVREHIDVSGKRDTVDLFQQKVLHRQTAEHASLSLSNMNLPERAVRQDMHTTQDTPTFPSSSRLSDERERALSGTPQIALAANAEDEQPLKKGWLLKKRDILSGWKCRYFEVFPSGRLDYFSDQNDREARGSVSLVESEISAVKAVAVKRVHEYWGITVETKHPEKMIRLASERTGLEGMVEATTWYQVLCIAKQTAEREREKENREKEKEKLGLTARRGGGGNNAAGAAGLHNVSVNKTVQVTNVTALQNRGLTPMALRRSKSVFSFPHDGDDPPSLAQKLLYFAIIAGLSALVVALYRSQRLSFKSTVVLCVLLTVLLVIFVHEFFLSPAERGAADEKSESQRERESAAVRTPQKGAVAAAVAVVAETPARERVSFGSSDGDADLVDAR